MKRYFDEFSLVEVQQTFYKLPLPETAKKWREQAGKDFEFVVKCSQLVTHPPSSPTYRKAGIPIKEEEKSKYGFLQPTRQVLLAWKKNLEICRILSAKICVVQCPPSFLPSEGNIKNMKKFFSKVKNDIKIAWEPRGKWGGDIIKELCKEFGLIHVVDPFFSKKLSDEVSYFRLHGKPAYNYRYRYTERELRELKKMIDGDTYILFNNIYMREDAKKFMEIMK